MSSQVITSAHQNEAPGSFQFPASLNPMHSRLSLLFIAGMFLFLATLGLSGWIRSRSLGILSSVVAFVSGVALMLVLSKFLR